MEINVFLSYFTLATIISIQLLQSPAVLISLRIIFIIIFINDIYFADENETNKLNTRKNDNNYDENLLTLSSKNKNGTKMLGRDNLGRDSIRTNLLRG